MTSLEEEWEVAKLLLKTTLDYDDALQYYIAKKKKLILVTLDKDFRKVHDIDVCFPEEVL